jgi:hypothetical protein
MEALVELCPNYWVELSPASGAGRHMVGDLHFSTRTPCNGAGMGTGESRITRMFGGWILLFSPIKLESTALFRFIWVLFLAVTTSLVMSSRIFGDYAE